ncbi:hypothetical protein [Vibrio sp. THAF190c]|uniref:hypothetical protein n=1 Tax=Vibrio sp. THAF190c TaxID=2587865 RepID=UPI001268733F|nr:hypothetical protein [Vibrio sp. THAF190c]QFT13503.1 hypothetical protein FIV04_26470 [Vibrio sp. THAF190c]
MKKLILISVVFATLVGCGRDSISNATANTTKAAAEKTVAIDQSTSEHLIGTKNGHVAAGFASLAAFAHNEREIAIEGN